MANLNIAIQIAAQDRASGPIGRIQQALGGLGNVGNRAVGALKGLGLMAGGAALGGVAALAGGAAAAGVAGLRMNNQMEIVTAQLNAFTKDGAKSAEILEMIRDRAARTPFAFQEMATATASLIPAANQSGKSIEELISLAEILAASNPAEGLEGAAFSLREALSGDFVSIVERFNLPRQRLKELKDEGVPALEAISTAMQELGLDAELVTNLSQTATGRMSTFKDTLVTLAATATAPIFDQFSDGLGVVNQWLTDNGPLLTAFAESIANDLAVGMDTVRNLITITMGEGGEATLALQDFQRNLMQLGLPAETVDFITTAFTNITTAVGVVQDIFNEFSTGAAPIFEAFWARLQENLAPAMELLTDAGGRIVDAFGRIFTALGGEEMDGMSMALQTLDFVLGNIATTIEVAANVVSILADALAWVIEKIAEAVEIGGQLVTIFEQLGASGGLGALASGTLDAVTGGLGSLVGGVGEQRAAAQAAGPYNPFAGGGQQVVNQINPTPVTINLDGQKIAESVSKYQGPIRTNYAALGGIGAQ